LQFLDIGIHEKHLSNIFQRFYRIESQHSRRNEGAGIGLSLVKELVEKHGGEISVKSKAGIGTTWYEHLPEKQVHFCDQLYPGISHENKSDSAIGLYLGRYCKFQKLTNCPVSAIKVLWYKPTTMIRRLHC